MLLLNTSRIRGGTYFEYTDIQYSTVRGANPTLYARKKLSGLIKNSQKFSSKKKGGKSGPGCRASKLLDFRPLLNLFLEAVSLRPGTCWLFILRIHFHIGSGQCIVSLYFHFVLEWAAKEQKPVIFTLFAMSFVPYVGLLQILRTEAYYTLPWVSKYTAQKTELA